MQKVTISFKDNAEEKELYDFLKSKMSSSYYIKGLLKEKLEEEKNVKPQSNAIRGFDFWCLI